MHSGQLRLRRRCVVSLRDHEGSDSEGFATSSTNVTILCNWRLPSKWAATVLCPPVAFLIIYIASACVVGVAEPQLYSDRCILSDGALGVPKNTDPVGVARVHRARRGSRGRRGPKGRRCGERGETSPLGITSATRITSTTGMGGNRPTTENGN